MKRSILERPTELLLYAASPLVLIITSPILAQGLGPADRGQLGVAQAVASFAIACGSLGQGELYIAERRMGAGNFRSASLVAWCGGAVAAAAAGMVLVALDVPLIIALATVVLIPLLSQSNLWRSEAVALRAFTRVGLSNAFGAALRLAFLFGLLLLMHLEVWTAIGAIQLATVIGALFSIGLYAYRVADKKGVERLSELLRRAARGSPMLVFNILTSVTLRGDLIVLQALAPAREVGVYAGASALSTAVLSMSGAFKSRVQASFFAKDPIRAFHREAIIVIAVAVAGAIAATLASGLIVDVLLGPGYELALIPMRLLSVASAGLLLLDVVHSSLAVLNRRRLLLVVGGIGASVTVVMLFITVPTLGATGAALSTLIAYFAAAIVGGIFIEKTLRRERADERRPITP